MLDIDFIQKNKELVEKAIKDRNKDPIDLNRLLELNAERKRLKGELDQVNQARNEAAKERNIEEGKSLKERAKAIEDSLKDVEKEFMKLMLQVPNIPSPDTPVGKDESANKVIRQVGKPTQFDFDPKPHWELGEALDVIDNETAAVVSGARFTYLKGDIARMQFALISLVMDTLTDQETLSDIAEKCELADISVTPFIPVVPPVMIRPAVFNRMARLEPRDDKFYIEKDDLFLTGSAEHTLGPMHMDHIFDEDALPVRYLGYSTAFRREAGSYGKDTKGILRLHQFDKLEMETFVLPEDSKKEQDFLVGIQEHLVQLLELPYQVVMISTGDMGEPDHRQMDIEVWMPGQDTYRETHTADLMGGYQARRLNTRVKRSGGKKEHVHMNDATAIAIGRTIIAIMENYQRADGSIMVPKVLQQYMGTDLIQKHE